MKLILAGHQHVDFHQIVAQVFGQATNAESPVAVAHHDFVATRCDGDDFDIHFQGDHRLRRFDCGWRFGFDGRGRFLFDVGGRFNYRLRWLCCGWLWFRRFGYGFRFTDFFFSCRWSFLHRSPPFGFVQQHRKTLLCGRHLPGVFVRIHPFRKQHPM